MSNDDTVQVQITVDSVGITRQGYGMPLLVSHNAGFAERVRYYTSPSAVGNDFASTSPERLWANAVFGQNPKPPKVAIGRADSNVTLEYFLTALEADNATAYSLKVKGEGVTATTATITTDSASSVAEVNSAMLTSLNAVTGKNYTATFPSLVVADLTFVGEADDDTLTCANILTNPDDTFTADNTTDIFTAAAHGLVTGDGPFQVSNGGGALPTGLAAVTDYWIIRLTDDTFQLATSVANAILGTALTISTNGTGTQTIADTVTTRRLAAHGLVTGDGPIQVSTTGGLPAGLLAATDYWIIRLSANTFKLASSLALALAGTALPLTTDGTGVQTLADTTSTVSPALGITLTATAAGDWFSIEVVDPEQFEIRQTHSSPTGLADDLDAILLASKLWYNLHTIYNSEAYVLTVAAWTEPAGRTYIFDTNNSDIINNDIETGDDLGIQLLALGYTRTSGGYHPSPAAMFSGAWMGAWLPYKPGAATAKFKTLTGVPNVDLNDTHKVNIKARRMNSYEEQFSRNITWEGTVFSTVYKYMDVTRDVDWLVDVVKTRVFGILAGSPKVPYTPQGIAKVQGSVLGAMDEAEQADVFAAGTTVVEVPLIEDVEEVDKEERVLRNVKFSGTLSGAIHSVIPVSGVVTF